MKLLASRGLFFGSLFALTITVGCKRQTENAAPDATAASAERPTASTTPAAPAVSSPSPRPSASSAKATRGGPTLEVLEPGTEPRKKLRYTFREGQSDELEMTQKMTMSMRLGNDVMPKTPAPQTRIVMKLAITALENDIATADFRVTDATLSPSAGAPPGVGAGVDHLLQDLKSYKGTQRVDRRGILLSFDQDTSGISNPQVSQMMNSMEQSMNQMMAPLPEEAIGKGATWRTVTHVDQFGLKLTQTTLFEVLSIDERGLDMNVVLSQTAPAGKISAPGLPLGMSVDLVSMDSSGKAKMRIDLDRLVPKSNMDMTVKMKMKVPEVAGPGTGDQIMAMTMDMVMNIAPK